MTTTMTFTVTITMAVTLTTAMEINTTNTLATSRVGMIESGLQRQCRGACSSPRAQDGIAVPHVPQAV